MDERAQRIFELRHELTVMKELYDQTHSELVAARTKIAGQQATIDQMVQYLFTLVGTAHDVVGFLNGIDFLYVCRLCNQKGRIQQPFEIEHEPTCPEYPGRKVS